MKVPPARDDIITSTSSPAFEHNMPMMTPSGVAQAKIKTSCLTRVKSLGKLLTREIPRAEPAAPLCTTIAIIISMVMPQSF